MGAVKRLGKTSARGRAGISGECSHKTSSTPGEGGREAGVRDGMVATGAVTCASERGAARMSSVAMCSQGWNPRCWCTKKSWVGVGRRFSFWLLRYSAS